MAADQLPLTGERTVPGIAEERYWFLRHEVVYHWLGGLLSGHEAPAGSPPDLSGQRLLDAGCGEGYGADWLAGAGAQVLALDYDAAAIAHVSRAYPRVGALRANLAGLPVATGSLDAVVSLQVIEHIWNLGEFLAECHRVLRPGGLLVVSTPNRPVFSPGLGRGEKPVNPFHVEEFDAQQVAARLATAGFAGVAVSGLHHAGRIRAWEHEHGPIVAAHVEAVTTGAWSPELLALLPRLTWCPPR